MKTFLLIVLLSLLIGCGKSSSTPSTSISTPTLDKVIDLPHHMYIVGGQSNAVRLLYYMSGQYPVSTNPVNDLTSVSPSLPTTGYAIGGTGIGYWQESVFNAPLLKMISDNCNKNPYFIWWQGEFDATGDLYLTYETTLIDFFNQVTSVCPTVQIVEVVVGEDINAQALTPNITEIQKIQRNLGYPTIESTPYEQYGLLQDVHLVEQGYSNMYQEILTRFPLSK